MADEMYDDALFNMKRQTRMVPKKPASINRNMSFERMDDKSSAHSDFIFAKKGNWVFHGGKWHLNV